MSQSSRPRLYIHVGLHKTASTYLQKHVFPSISDVHYRQVPAAVKKALQAINREAGSSDKLVTEFKEILRESFGDLVDCTQPSLISEEMLSGYMLKGYQNTSLVASVLHEVFSSHFEVHIVLLIRRQDDFLESGYRQALQQYSPVSITEYLNLQQDVSPESINDIRLQASISLFNWSRIYRIYAEIFDPPKVHVFLQEKLANEPFEFAQDLQRVLHASTPPAMPRKRANIGYSAVTARIALGVNKIVSPNMQRQWARWRREVLAESSGIQRRFYRPLSAALDTRYFLQEIIDPMFNFRREIFSRDIKRAILDKHLCSNRELDELLWLEMKHYGYY